MTENTDATVAGGEDLPGWEWERTVEDSDAVDVGDSVTFSKEISDDDVTSFAAASGDTNPLHLEDDYAAETRFGGRIAHGMLVGGLISAALARFPGTVVYLSQDFEFKGPVRIGDRATAEVEVVETLDGGRYRLSTQVLVDGEAVIDGEAVVLIDEEP
ncbi:phosphate butyryltransferase protein [Halorhabdus tiamatea SARL4B]|uniref:MaoC family protein n=1 Tax=Halorhabdus tiamatea SARL4B TaxID=1033806 RepID=F7PFZ6_9EURY|nr:MaoC family dehydratase [Halorhabdus tiamatea]ERJ07282.1 phosphate butyryltransferase protein [Halorhabdus tiamatea SARL4B]CCQ34192.1 MaoC family protein [Halorhabdus tiamatea SARL4B]